MVVCAARILKRRGNFAGGNCAKIIVLPSVLVRRFDGAFLSPNACGQSRRFSAKLREQCVRDSYESQKESQGEEKSQEGAMSNPQSWVSRVRSLGRRLP